MVKQYYIVPEIETMDVEAEGAILVDSPGSTVQFPEFGGGEQEMF